MADAEDKNKDGISGRPNYVRNVINGNLELGRFGWKANEPNVKQQVAAAFQGDMGLSSSLFSEENQTCRSCFPSAADYQSLGLCSRCSHP